MLHLPIKPKLFKDNRRRLAELLEPQSLAVVNANDVLPTNADGTYHPSECRLFYLTGIEQEESILPVLMPDPKHREILFLLNQANTSGFGKASNTARRKQERFPESTQFTGSVNFQCFSRSSCLGKQAYRTTTNTTEPPTR